MACVSVTRDSVAHFLLVARTFHTGSYLGFSVVLVARVVAVAVVSAGMSGALTDSYAFRMSGWVLAQAQV